MVLNTPTNTTKAHKDHNMTHIPDTITEQLEILGEYHVAVALAELISDLNHQPFLNRLNDLALSRMTSGYEMYGTDMFEKSNASLDQDAMEELADFLVYRCAQRYLRNQRNERRDSE